MSSITIKNKGINYQINNIVLFNIQHLILYNLVILIFTLKTIMMMYIIYFTCIVFHLAKKTPEPIINHLSGIQK